jgi:3-hydroxybutyryl-CoA dehydrogenase
MEAWMEESKKARVVGVVGAGVMGVDLALDLAIHGHEVVLVDNVDAQLESVPARIRSNLRFMKLQGGVKVAAPTDQLLARIQRLRGLDALADAEFVVENVVEDEAVKKEVYGELGTHVRPDAILCANTSCVPITKIGSWVPFPERVVGTHFMNPVPLKSMVEVIRGDRTSEH